MRLDTTPRTASLRRFGDDWRRLPWVAHTAAVLLLAILALLRWSFLRSPTPLGDEDVYLQAFETIRQGGIPYDVKGFFYPPAFAHAGAWLLGTLDVGGTLIFLRGANLLGLAFAFWTATIWLPMPIPARWLAAALLLCLSPAAHAGLDLGNVSFLIVGLTLVALLSWPRRPLLSGVLLGTSVALKPIAAALIPILLAYRPHRRPDSGHGRHLKAGLAAAASAAALLLPFSGLDEMLRQEMVALAYARSYSLQRLVALLGIGVDQVVLTLIGLAIAVAAVRRRPMSSVQLMCAAVATVSLVTPLVWNHTLIVALPVQGLALALAWQRPVSVKEQAGQAFFGGRLELAFVALGILMMHAGTAAGFDHLRPMIQIVLLLAVGLAPAVVCSYVFILTETLELPLADRSPHRAAAGRR